MLGALYATAVGEPSQIPSHCWLSVSNSRHLSMSKQFATNAVSWVLDPSLTCLTIRLINPIIGSVCGMFCMYVITATVVSSGRQVSSSATCDHCANCALLHKCNFSAHYIRC